MYNLQNAKNILIAHMEGMGDNILSIPLLHNIRTSLRNARLDMLIPKGRLDIFHSQKLDRVFECAGTLPQQVLDTTYDVVFDLSTGYISPSYVYHLQCDRLVCFKKCVQFENETSVSWIQDVPAWQQMLNLLTLTDLSLRYRKDYAFYVSEANLKFSQFLKESIGTDCIIYIVPGSGGSDDKRWNPRCFAQLIGYLHETFSYHIVLVGYYTERHLGHYIEEILPCEITNLMGMTSVGALAGLLRDAKLVVSNDTGTMHLAGILNTPLIALFGPTNPKEYGPLGNNHRIITSDTQEMSEISVDRVIEVCYEMLTKDD